MVNKLYFIVVVVVMLYGPNCTDFPSLSQRKIAGLSFTNETLRIIINGKISILAWGIYILYLYCQYNYMLNNYMKTEQ